jgi:hypothetical protein
VHRAINYSDINARYAMPQPKLRDNEGVRLSFMPLEYLPAQSPANV